jgi:ribosome-associated protein
MSQTPARPPFPLASPAPTCYLRKPLSSTKDKALSATRTTRTGKKTETGTATTKASAAKAAKAAAQPKSPDPLELARLVAQQLDDDKAENILNIPLAGKSPMADVMVVASGRSARHVSALADHVSQKLKEAGATRVRVEGLPHADWVLVDAGDVIVHIFRPEVREFYNLERIWAGDTPTTAHTAH